MKNANTVSSTSDEVMVEATQAAAALSLPYYWFSHNTMRDRLRIPHYLLGNLVRYRITELALWVEQCNAAQKHAVEHSTNKEAS